MRPELQPRREARIGGAEVWTLGRVTAVMPALDEAWPEPVQAAWHRRLMANLTLACPGCRATAKGTAVAGVAIDHAPTCDASDERFGAMLDEVMR